MSWHLLGPPGRQGQGPATQYGTRGDRREGLCGPQGGMMVGEGDHVTVLLHCWAMGRTVAPGHLRGRLSGHPW